MKKPPISPRPQPIAVFSPGRPARVNGKIILSDNQIIHVNAGHYENLGSGQWNNGIHSITLPRDFQLMVLTIGFLKQFINTPLIKDILYKSENAAFRAPNGLRADKQPVFKFSAIDLLKILAVINSALAAQGLRLRLPAEAVIDVLACARQYNQTRANIWFLKLWVPVATSGSKESVFSVETEVFDVETLYLEAGSKPAKPPIDPIQQTTEEGLTILQRKQTASLLVPYRDLIDSTDERFSQPANFQSTFNGAILEIVQGRSQ